jgi:hypothetical protein
VRIDHGRTRVSILPGIFFCPEIKKGSLDGEPRKVTRGSKETADMRTISPKKNPGQSKSLKLSRNMRGIPATTYRMRGDGRKWKMLCDQRKQLADWLATYGDGDGTRIFPKVATMLAAFDTWSRAKIFARLKDLRALGVMQPEGRKGEHGPRIRRLIPPKPIKAEVSDSFSEVSDSATNEIAEVSDSKAEVSDRKA